MDLAQAVQAWLCYLDPEFANSEAFEQSDISSTKAEPTDPALLAASTEAAIGKAVGSTVVRVQPVDVLKNPSLQGLLANPDIEALLLRYEGGYLPLVRWQKGLKWVVLGKTGTALIFDPANLPEEIWPGSLRIIREPQAELAASSETPAYLQMFRAFGPRYLEIGFSSLIVNVCGMLLPLFSMLVYDKVVGNGNIETLWALAIGMLLFVGLEMLLRVIRLYSVEQMAAASDMRMERELMDRVLHSKARSLAPLGMFLSRYRDHASTRDSLFSQYLVAVTDLPFLLLFWLLLLFIGGPIVLVPILMGGLLLLGHMLLHRPARDYGVRTGVSNAKKVGLLAELLDGIDLIKVSPIRSVLDRKWQGLLADSALTRARGRFWHGMSSAWSAACITLSSVITLVVGVYLIQAGTLSVGTLIACSLIVNRAMASAASVVGMAVALKDLDRTHADLQETTEAAAPVAQLQAPRPVAGEIVVRDLRCRFAGRGIALDGLNLHIKTGERVALVGSPGSGKSTVLRCLAGVLEADEGQVLIDQVDIALHGRDAIGQWLSYKPQEPRILGASLADNLLMGLGNSNAIRFQAMLKMTGLEQSIHSGQLRLDLEVSPGGLNLSGGQRQIIALSRALNQDAAIYLLDEPTSGIDSATEEKLAHAVANLTRGKTLVMATHSTRMLALVDRIIVLADGKLLADGDREKMLG